MNAPYLVTGGSGYFGERLVSALLAGGQRVRIFDLNPPSFDDPALEVMLGDIRDARAVAAAVQGAGVIHHNVAQVPLARDRKLFWSVNHDGTAILLEAARGAGVSKVVYTSSSAVFGVPKSNPVSEATEPAPGEAYGRAKLAGERLCHAYREKGLGVSIIRPRTVVGHGRLGIFQVLFEWIRRGRDVPVLGRGDNVYQFVHADDLAAACIAAGERPGSATYNIGAARYGTMRQMLEALIAHAGTKSRVKSVPLAPAVAAMKIAGALGLSPLGPYHWLMYGRSLYFDISKAVAELAFAPRYGSDEMFAESYDWYCRNRAAVLARKEGRSLHQSPLRQGALALTPHLLRLLP